ncbi:MAG: hypothetical protein U1F43_13950 [Myxococcota bacterium]
MTDRSAFVLALAALAALAAGALGAGALAACGDPIVAGSYRGEPLYSIDGWVQLMVSPDDLLGAGEDASELRVAILWSQTKGSSFNLEGAVQQEVVATGTFPARFEVTLYEPPADDILRDVPGGTGQMAIAALVAYVDDDDDEVWDRDSESLVGGAGDRLFLYTPEGLSSPAFGDLAAGFHRLVPTATCGDPVLADASTVRYAADTTVDIDLTVDGEFPASALIDVDCNSDTFDWAGVCPPLDFVRRQCRDGDGMVAADPTSPMCLACDDRLWPIDAEGDPSQCDDWFVGCLENAPPNECEFEWHACRGDPPIGPHPDHDCNDLRCVCDHAYSECRERGGDDLICQAYQQDCMRR